MKNITIILVTIFGVTFGWSQSEIIISQYIETSSGFTPKGIEIFNISGADITFTPTNNLQIYQGTNGASCSALPGTNITSGVLRANEVWVIGTTDLTTYANSNGINLSGTTDYGFSFNGDDALQLYLGGTLQDAFGTCGSDPGSLWSGGGVSTANNNLELIDGLCNGNLTGWSDPSTRFNQISDGLTMTGFGDSPAICCLSSTTWTSSGWSSGAPTINTEVFIDADYYTSSANISACSLTINVGSTLYVENNTYAEIEHDVTVNGELYVESSGNFVQNNDDGNFSLNAGGVAQVNKTTPFKSEWYYYTYWSSPVKNQLIRDAFPNVDGDRRFWFNAANFHDGNGDDIDDDANDWQHAPGNTVMTPGVGYASTEARLFFGGNGTATFEGEFNTRDIPVSIDFDPANPGMKWNFIGNPYPSAIDFVAFHAANSSIVEGVAYFWSQASPPESSNPGNEQLNFNTNDYATFTVGTGGAAGGVASEIPTGYVASAQGFFIPALTPGTATFTNAMRMADETSNAQFFKGATKSKRTNTRNPLENRLWVNLTSDNGVFNQILVGYVDHATSGNDGLMYDAPKLLTPDLSTVFYSLMDDDATKYVIQGKNINSINEDETIILGFKTKIKVATLYSLSIAKMEGDFLNSHSVFVKDNLLNKVHDLTVCDYTFTSETGEFNKRFEIVFKADALSTANALANPSQLKIVGLENDNVQFTAPNGLQIKTVSVFDLFGRQLYQFNGQNDTEVFKLSNLNSSVFVAKVVLSNGSVISKKAIKK